MTKGSSEEDIKQWVMVSGDKAGGSLIQTRAGSTLGDDQRG